VLAGLALLLQRVRLEAARGAAPPAERLLDELLRMLGPSTALSDAQCRAARGLAPRARRAAECLAGREGRRALSPCMCRATATACLNQGWSLAAGLCRALRLSELACPGVPCWLRLSAELRGRAPS